MESDPPHLKAWRRDRRSELGLPPDPRDEDDYEMADSPFYGERETTMASTATLGEDRRFIVAIDFGTTFSSVSFLALPRDTGEDDDLNAHLYVDEIQSIANYPAERRLGFQASRKQVPTEIWYPKRMYMNEELLARNRPSDPVDLENEDNGQAPPNGDQDTNEDADMDIDEEADDEENNDIFWGYEVQLQLRFPDTNRNQNRRISRFKLLLDESKLTREIRLDLEPNFKELKRRKMIRNKEDVIADYLKFLFSHAKSELIRNYDFSDTCPVEFVLCVPPIWKPKASRTMQTNMERAIRESGFGSVENDSVNQLFIVSEPEAAAAYVLASTTAILPRETFVLIDAGGGTVDVITYTVNTTYPLRLQAESVPAGGGLCGSSYLNEAYQRHLRARLQGEDYLEVNGLTIESIIDSLVVGFENGFKREVDVTKANLATEIVFLQGLRANAHPSKRFFGNRVRVERADLMEIFLPVLQSVALLMREQLDGAIERRLNVKKVILIGGFAESPSLRKYLQRELDGLLNLNNEKIRLIVPQVPETAVSAVSSGAVLRALNKNAGPLRISRSSYGFLCTEEHEPDVFPAHNGVRPYSDPLDGRKYVKYTIFWLINMGDEIPAKHEYSIPVFYIFDADEDTRFECKEYLYVSDKKMESHYRRSHEKNTDASVVGVIETDMTFLKEQNLIQPVEPEENVRAKRHYKVEYELVMIVNDRNMVWEARYPAGGAVQGKGQISIAAAFVPGTK